MQYVYKRAMDNMIAWPTSIADIQDAKKIPYIGPGIIAKLECRLRKFTSDGGRLINAEIVQLSQPVATMRISNDSQAIAPLSQAAGPAETTAPKAPKRPRTARPYIPTFRSGPYAMLIALMLDSQNPDTKGYCTRQDILAMGQPYCSVPMEEGTYSALNGAIKKLLEKELVTKQGHPPRYTITDEGLEIAEKLWNSGERRSSNPPTTAIQMPEPTRPSPIEKEIEAIDDNGEEVADQRLLVFNWKPGTYDLHLLLDNREVKSRTERDFIFNTLTSFGLPVEQRALDLGDFLWMAKKKQQFRNGGHDDLEEVVLDLVIERKTEDDLRSSILDGRFIEQKNRLNSSGITNRIYLLEKYDGVDLSGIGENKFRAAVVHTQIVDNLFLRYTANLEDSLKFILATHKDLVQKFSQKQLNFVVAPDVQSIRKATFLAVLAEQCMKDQQHYLMTYGCYSAINSKSGAMTMKDMFIRQLIAVPSLSADKAVYISASFPTAISMYELYCTLPDDDARKEYFTNWTLPGQSRRFGPALSLRIYETFWCK